jgi:hypothetical protein
MGDPEEDMGMLDELKQVQETRIAGKETSATLVDPGPFDTPLETPDKKAAEEEPVEEERTEEKEEEKEEDVKTEEEDVPAEKIKSMLEKYKTPEEIAKASYRAQKQLSVITNDAAKLRKENEELKQRRYTPPSAPQAETPKPEIPIEEVIADRYYTDIARLPEDEPDRDKKVVKLMARMNAEISVAKQRESEKKAEEMDRHIQSVEARVKELGLADEHLDDFWIYASVAPKYLDKEAAIQWTLDRVNKIKGNGDAIKQETAEKTLEKVRADEKEKKRMAPLGKGGLKIAERKTEEEPALSLSDALRNMNRQRVHK